MKVLGRDPVLQMRAAAGLLHVVPLDEAALNLEARDEARAARRNVPVARDLDGVVLGEHRIEDRLIRQARRECTHAGLLDQLELFRPDWAPEGEGVFGGG